MFDIFYGGILMIKHVSYNHNNFISVSFDFISFQQHTSPNICSENYFSDTHKPLYLKSIYTFNHFKFRNIMTSIVTDNLLSFTKNDSFYYCFNFNN